MVPYEWAKFLHVRMDQINPRVDIDFHEGECYRALERVTNTLDYLDDITKLLTTPEKAAEAAGKHAE